MGSVKRNLGIGYIIKELVSEELKRGIFKEIKIEELPKTGISLVYLPEYITTTPKEFLNKYYNIEL